MNQRTNLKTVLLLSALSVIFLVTTGCGDDTTTGTKINPDGSCVRTITVKSKDKDFLQEPFPCPGPNAQGWKIERKWEIKDESAYEENDSKKSAGDKSKKYVYTAEKYFSKVSDLNEEFSETGTTGRHPLPVKIDYRLEKRFAWFFTYYTYRETYRKYMPFNRVPISKFLDQKELDILVYGLQNPKAVEKKYSEKFLDGLWKKFEKWYFQSAFEEFIHVLLEGLEKNGNPKLKGIKTWLVEQKNELMHFVKDEKTVTEVMEKTSEFLKVPELMELMESHKKDFEELDRKYIAVEALIYDEFNNHVSMPGIITDTNANTVAGNTVSWKFNGPVFLLIDFEMMVESRMVNWWTVGIGGAILFLGLGILLAGAMRRLKNN